MKVFTDKNIFKKLTIIILITIIIPFICPQPVQADVGGKLFEPVKDLVLGIGDATMTILQGLIMGDYSISYEVEGAARRLGNILGWMAGKMDNGCII